MVVAAVVVAVATNGGQTTMDLAWWKEHVPGYDRSHRDFRQALGIETEQEYREKVAEISALSLISEDDPPIYMTYQMAPDDPVPDDPQRAGGWKIHHVAFGAALKEKMDELGVEAGLNYPGARPAYRSLAHFLIAKLTGE